MALIEVVSFVFILNSMRHLGAVLMRKRFFIFLFLKNIIQPYTIWIVINNRVQIVSLYLYEYYFNQGAFVQTFRVYPDFDQAVGLYHGVDKP